MDATPAEPTRASRFAPVAPEALERWSAFGRWDRVYFPSLVGLEIEEIRTDYCRMRMPFRHDLEQPAGVVHGGAIATLLDTVVVPAVGQAYGPDARFSTVDFHLQYLSALAVDDAVAEGWVVRRGRTLVFCEAEAVAVRTGAVVARALLTYHVSTGRPPREHA
ncbi:MAG: PaaI family thioesterase [Ilumatobacteraceae bacterium]